MYSAFRSLIPLHQFSNSLPHSEAHSGNATTIKCGSDLGRPGYEFYLDISPAMEYI